MMVELPPDFAPKAEVYIDDTFCAFLKRDRQRGSAIIPFVTWIFGRPVHEDEPLPRADVLSLKKFVAEATPSEQKIILGWMLDTRRLLLSLPDDKVDSWRHSIRALLATEWVSGSELETTIGRLNHVGYILPLCRHFLADLRYALQVAKRRRGGTVRFTEHQRADLEIWMEFLEDARTGVSLNLLTFRDPTHVFRVDACEHGVGGYCLDTGLAWRWEIPEDLRYRVTLNGLEFLGGYLMLALAASHHRIQPEACVLVQGDSTSATGWMKKSNFAVEDRPFHRWVARSLARLLMGVSARLFSQWFPGDLNNIADCLSRDHHMTDSNLESHMHLHFPTQITPTFTICQLPPDALSAVICEMRKLPQSVASRRAIHRSKMPTGETTSSISMPSNSTTTSSWKASPHMSKADCLAVTSLLTANCDSDQPIGRSARALSRSQFGPPSTQWLRPSGYTGLIGQHASETANSSSFWSVSSGDTPTPTPQPKDRKPSHQASCEN